MYHQEQPAKKGIAGFINTKGISFRNIFKRLVDITITKEISRHSLILLGNKKTNTERK